MLPATTLFLAGDVMLGRGVDQVLPHSCPPVLHEPWIGSALEYVELAERTHGPISAPVGFDWVWGDLLAVLRRRAPDVRVINLETAVTTCDEPAPKGIHYRMHPGNVPVLSEAGIDVCVLSNNHVLDWGRAGLVETLRTLEAEGLAVAGAGRDADAATGPAVVAMRAAGDIQTSASPAESEDEDGRRVLVFGIGGPDCGIPRDWAAAPRGPGVHLISGYSDASVAAVTRIVERVRRPEDVLVASIHWGPNWGYEIPREHRRFAHALVERAGVHVVHGHSSHHPLAAELHRGSLVLYGCGDLVTDYEGISGHEEYRGDLGLAYFVTVETGEGVTALELEPFQMRNFRLRRPSDADRAWLLGRLRREYGRFGLEVEEGRAFRVRWS